MNVTLPNGQVINNVPDNITQSQIKDLAIKNNLATETDFSSPKPMPTQKFAVPVDSSAKKTIAPVSNFTTKNVTLPNGQVINNVPDNITQSQIKDLAIKNNLATETDFTSPMEQAAAEGSQPTDAVFTMDSLDTNKAWLDSARKIYQSEKGALPIEMQRDPAKLAQWLKTRHSEIGWSIANVYGKGIAETALTTFDMKDDAKQAWINSLDMYEKTDSDLGSAARAIGNVALDPTTWGSLIFGFGVGGIAKLAGQKAVSKVAITAFKKELVKSLAQAGYKKGAVNRAVTEGVSRAIPAEVLKTHAKSAATKAATKKVGTAAATGAIYSGAFDAANQQFGMNIDDDKDFNYGQFAAMTGIGAVLGAGLSGVGTGIRKLRGKQSELAKFEDDIAKQVDTEASFRKEALSVGPTATRAVDFKETGNYDVVLSDGSKVQIFRDTEQFSYPVWNRVGENNPYTVGIGSTKKEALESLEDSLPKKSSPSKSAAKRQKKLEADEEAAYKDLDTTGPNVDSRGRIIQTIGNANTFLGRLLTSSGALAKPLADSNVRRENIDALQLQGKRLFKNFKKEYKKLGQAQKDKVNNYLSTDKDGDEFSEGFRKAVDEIRKYIPKNQETFNIAAGLEGNSKLGFGQKKGEVYFTRFFEAENNPAYFQRVKKALYSKEGNRVPWSKARSKEIKNRIDNMRIELEKKKIVNREKQDEIILGIVSSLAKGESDLFTDALVKSSVKNAATTKRLTKRKLTDTEYDKAVRELLGEVDDPLKKIQKTFDTQTRLIGQAQYLADVDKYAREALKQSGKEFVDIPMGGLIPKLPTRIERIKTTKIKKKKVNILDAEKKVLRYKSGPKEGKPKQKFIYERQDDGLNDFIQKSLGNRANSAGVLQGLYVTPNMATYIRTGINIFDGSKEVNKFMAPIQNLAAIGQASQTIFDIPAYALNTVGAITMAAANGHILNPYAYKAAKEAVKNTVEQVRLKDKNAIEKLEKLKRAGLIDSDLSAELIRTNVNRSLTNPKNILTKGYKSAMDKAGKAYGQPDTFAKLFAFESELNSVRKMFGKNLSEEDLINLAIDRTRATIPTYSAAVPLARQLSRLPIGTYALFPSEIVRTSKNIIKVGVTDIRDGIKNKNAAQIKAGLNRLVAFGAVTAGTEAMINNSNESLGIDKDTANALEQVMAPWYKNTVRQHNTGLVENDQGDIITNFRNSSQYDAYDFIKQPIRVITGKLLAGENVTDTEVDEALSGLAASAVGPYTNPKFLTQALLNIVDGDTKDQGGIYSGAVGEQGLSLENTQRALLELAESFEPGTTQIIRQYWSSLKAEEKAEEVKLAARTSKGFPLERKDIEWHMGTGIKPQTMNVDKSIGYTLSEDVKAIQQTGNEFVNYLRDLPSEVYSPERRQDILDKYRYYQDLKYKGMQDLAGKIDRIKQIKYTDAKGQDKTIDGTKLYRIVSADGWYDVKDDIIYAGYAGKPLDIVNEGANKEGVFMPDDPADEVINQYIRSKSLPRELVNDLYNIYQEYAGISLRPQAEKN